MSNQCKAGFEIPDEAPCAHCGATDQQECQAGSYAELAAQRDAIEREAKHAWGHCKGYVVTSDWADEGRVSLSIAVLWLRELAEARKVEVQRLEAQRDDLRCELSHLVRLLEPLEEAGKLPPGLATLNGARAAIFSTGHKP